MAVQHDPREEQSAPALQRPDEQTPKNKTP